MKREPAEPQGFIKPTGVGIPRLQAGEEVKTTLPFTGGNAQIPTIWLWAGLALLIIAAGAFSPMIRLRMGAGSKGRHAGTPTIGRHSR